jgi:TetR/AcrR family transcriptional repressor of nem operon
MPWEKQFDVDEVLDRAMRRFWEHGYAATSMRDLVEATAVNRASLYATYGDKHALFLKALQRYDETRRQQILAELEAKHPPREAIRRLFSEFACPGEQEGGHHGCFLTNTALELAAHDPQAAHIVAHAQRQIEAFFARRIRAGQTSGEIPATIDAATTARSLLASLLGLVVLSRSRPEPALLESIMNNTLRQLD